MKESFGTEDTKELDAEYAKLMVEDKIYFDAADTNKDGILNYEEFQAFQNPEHYSHMHPALIKVILSFVNIRIFKLFICRILYRKKTQTKMGRLISKNSLVMFMINHSPSFI